MYNGDFSKWVNAAGAQIPIYDPTTQAINSTTGVVTRTPFANNQIPQTLIAPDATKALGVFASGRRPIAPNNGAAPGTLGLRHQQLPDHLRLPGQPDQQVEHQGRPHLLRQGPHLRLLRLRSRKDGPGSAGPATLPGNYTNYNDLTQSSDVFRMSWDHTFGPTKYNHFYAGGNNWRQNHNPPQEYIGNWKRQVLPAQRAGLQREPGQLHLQQRLRRLGRPGQQRLGKHRLRLQRRFHLGQGHAHLQGRRHVPADALQRLRPPVRLRLRRASTSRKPDAAAIPTSPPPAAIRSPPCCSGYADSGSSIPSASSASSSLTSPATCRTTGASAGN